MQRNDGFPIPDCFLDNSETDDLRHQLRRLRLNEMKLAVVKAENSQWLQKRGKKQYVGFTPQLRSEAKRLFTALDTDGSGALSVGELYLPLLASGAVESKGQVKQIMKKATVGEVMEFREFLGQLEAGQNTEMRQLAKDYLKGYSHRLLPPQVVISTRRRKLMMQAYVGDTPANREKGLRVLKAFSGELVEQTQEKKGELLLAKRRTEVRRSLKSARPSAPTS